MRFEGGYIYNMWKNPVMVFSGFILVLELDSRGGGFGAAIS